MILASLALPCLFLSLDFPFQWVINISKAEFSFFHLKLPFLSYLHVGYWCCHVPNWPRLKFQAPFGPPFTVGSHVHLPACTTVDIALEMGAPGY